MTDKLKAYLDGLFSTVPMTDEIKEVKDELYDGMVERYNDCVADGMEAQEAYDKVIDSIGDIHELFDELIADGTVDFSKGKPDDNRDPKQAAESYADAVREDKNSQDEFRFNDFVKNITDFTSGLMSGLFSGGEKSEPGLKLVNTRVLPLDDINSIDIGYVAESITILKSENGQFELREYMNRDDDATLFADITMRNKSIIVKNGRRTGVFGLRTRIEICMPEQWDGSFYVGTVSGSIKSDEEWKFASFSAKTISGSIKTNAVEAGMIRLASTSGSLYIEKATGTLEMSSVSGSLRAENVNGNGKFSSTSGSVKLNFEAVDGHISASSVSGGVRLALPEDASFELDAKSVSGNIHTAFDHLLTYQKRKTAHGFVGNAPYFHVRLSTTSGGIHVND